jgi:hypothetical protein
MLNIRFCNDTCLDSNLVKGKIVLCDHLEGWVEASRAGALGSIVTNDFRTDVSFVVPLSASAIHIVKSVELQRYISSTE